MLNSLIIKNPNKVRRRTPRGCVNWNVGNLLESHYVVGRTPRGCVNWNITSIPRRPNIISRTPRGCVNWNTIESEILGGVSVIPHIGTWIETAFWKIRWMRLRVVLHGGVWIGYIMHIRLNIMQTSHLVWVRELKPVVEVAVVEVLLLYLSLVGCFSCFFWDYGLWSMGFWGMAAYRTFGPIT